MSALMSPCTREAEFPPMHQNLPLQINTASSGKKNNSNRYLNIWERITSSPSLEKTCETIQSNTHLLPAFPTTAHPPGQHLSAEPSCIKARRFWSSDLLHPEGRPQQKVWVELLGAGVLLLEPGGRTVRSVLSRLHAIGCLRPARGEQGVGAPFHGAGETQSNFAHWK